MTTIEEIKACINKCEDRISEMYDSGPLYEEMYDTYSNCYEDLVSIIESYIYTLENKKD